MSSEKKVILIIIAGFIGFSILSCLPAPESKDLIRLAINCILCWFLYKGANWSRWVMAVLSSLASIVITVALIKLPLQSADQIAVMLELAIMLSFYSAAAFILFTQKSIKNHFVRTR